ncbi:PREDICTED: cadherin-like and PC-esterase domain-containing protein 1 [Priapulus caudatus]|uniref:Cadherin-like and PC-esterase domain-containing protein 1 n=1 Tax=Priapulus caudatus TaxID=37621 RepID=A0ABM1EFG9_PRICU|nr:PREDICTED: cadherin-like and PC-esterase domain-containing protein 1 [Priapulus caudatus]
MEFAISRLPLCTTGYAPGRWLVPCGSCYDRQSCYWPKAVWQPYDCRYMDLNKKNIQACLAGRTILFQGDSILRGIFDYMHGALKLKKGTGNASGQHIYVTTSNKGKKVAMQYSRILAYEEDDVVDIPRYFNSEFDKLLSTGGKIENTKNTIFALGGAYWMQPAIYKWFMGRLDNAGLTNVTVVIKMDNAALHHPQIKTPSLWDPVRHLKRNLAVAHIIESEKQRSQNVKLVNPINITMPMFQGFHDGGFCSCHFHKYHLNATYAVDGHVQKMYIKPFFHTLCLGETDRRS